MRKRRRGVCAGGITREGGGVMVSATIERIRGRERGIRRATQHYQPSVGLAGRREIMFSTSEGDLPRRLTAGADAIKHSRH